MNDLVFSTSIVLAYEFQSYHVATTTTNINELTFTSELKKLVSSIVINDL